MPVVERSYMRLSVIRAVEDMEYSCTLDLGLRPPGHLPWTRITFVPREEMNRRGLTCGRFYPDTFAIEIAHDLSEATAATTCAHELRHLWQRLNWPADALRDKYLKEADAHQYEDEAMRRFWNPHLYFRERIPQAA